ncbi:hypothetical protein OQA88_442 [Cercophora sp. LCS_1]
MAPAPDKLTPDDSRVEHHTVQIRGNNWHYLLAKPDGAPSATIVLVHGWPDLAFGWRYQVPYLLSLNLRVIVPDMLGYGQTDAPDAVEEYSMKKIAGDIRDLAAHVVGPEEKIILGGHDWGGAVVWKTAMWYPEIVHAVISVCTPYFAPREAWIAPEDLVKMLPNFKYQLHLAGPEVEAKIVGEEKLRQFLSALYGARGPNKEAAFTTAQGVVFENLDKLGQSPLLTPEEVDFYVKEYARKGMHGPLNWYRTARVNWEEELPLLKEGPERVRIKAPSLMITASKDAALPPAMTAKMGDLVEKLSRGEVDTTHWALWEAPSEVNKYIGDFLAGVFGGEQASRL